MSTQYGFPSFNNTQNNQNQGALAQAIAAAGSQLTPVRVKSIILTSEHPRFKELGEWNSLGAIEFEPVSNPSGQSNKLSVAYPLYPNVKNIKDAVREMLVNYKK